MNQFSAFHHFIERMFPESGGAHRAGDRLRHAVPAHLRAVLLARQVALLRRRQEGRPLLTTWLN